MVAAGCPNNRLVSLPSTMLFVDDEDRREAATIFGDHRNVILMARDPVSAASAREVFPDHIEIVATHDSTVRLPVQPRLAKPIHDIIWLARDDKEGADTQGAGRRQCIRLAAGRPPKACASCFPAASSRSVRKTAPVLDSISNPADHRLLRPLRPLGPRQRQPAAGYRQGAGDRSHAPAYPRRAALAACRAAARSVRKEPRGLRTHQPRLQFGSLGRHARGALWKSPANWPAILPGASMMEGVGKRLTVGAMWTAGGRVISNLLGIVSTLTVARLLTPDDFGLVAIATVIFAIVRAVTELSLSSALIQHKDPQREHYDTAFTLSIFRSLAIALVLAAAAFPPRRRLSRRPVGRDLLHAGRHRLRQRPDQSEICRLSPRALLPPGDLHRPDQQACRPRGRRSPSRSCSRVTGRW